IALIAEMLGLSTLAFAVGVYLPVATSGALFVGGVIRRIAMAKTGMTDAEADAGKGTLYASGLIAGGALAGLALAPPTYYKLNEVLAIGPKIVPWLAQSNVAALIIVLALGYSLYRYAMKK